MTGQIEQVRAGRSSGAVLKIAISNIRARNKTIPILVFEGITDVGPYEVWISRIRHGWSYQPLPAAGKGQVLDLRRRLQHDTTGLRAAVAFLVDRDFDDLRGHSGGSDIFCTDTYSIENYLVSEEVLQSILLDELKCAERHSEREAAALMFITAREQFNLCMSDVNKRIFCARKLNIQVTKLSKSVSRYLSIQVSSVTRSSDTTVEEFVALQREYLDSEASAFDGEFAKLEPNTRHRGKYTLEFFLRWLEELAKEFRTGGCQVFPTQFDSGFSVHSLTLRSLASRSRIPHGLSEFLSNIDSAPSSVRET